MATFTLTVPDALVPDMLDAFAALYGYDAATDGTRANFAKGKIRDYVKEVYTAHQATIGAEAARQSAISAADTTTADVDVT